MENNYEPKEKLYSKKKSMILNIDEKTKEKFRNAEVEPEILACIKYLKEWRERSLLALYS